MSYDRNYNSGGGGAGGGYRGGGRRQNYRDEQDDYRRDYVTPEQRLKNSIISVGEVDPTKEVQRVAGQIRDQVPREIGAIAEGFRLGVTEQPYKIPYYASLLRQLHEPVVTGPSLAKLILEEFWKGFQTYLDTLAWRQIRLCIQFFAHLTVAKMITPSGMCDLLKSFTTVLEEFGVSHGRAKKAALCAAEGLMIAGASIKTEAEGLVTEIIDAIQAYTDSTASQKWLVESSVKMFSDEVVLENSDELLDTVLVSLRAFSVGDFAESASSFVMPYSNLDDSTLEPFEVSGVLVPPELVDLDGLSTDAGEEAQGTVKREEWPEYHLRLFDNAITPDPTTPAGYAVRTALLDTIDIFEVNRKECARLLLEYPKWALPGTFKAKPGAPAEDVVEGKGWQLESTIIETILGAYLVLPEASHKSIYYISLITELCKLSPTTVGPAVGKSIRKLYGGLAEGLDVEISRRFAEWFAVHMSNFGFQWVWKEWVPDLDLAIQHPRRTFMRRALEFEIRLSYHDRILKTLPAPMQEPSGHTLPEHAPGPDFAYEEPESPHHEAAKAVLELLRGRAKAEDVISHLDTLKASLEDVVNVDTVIRSIAVQCLMHIGSRSFSHFLNAIERYLVLLRTLASDGVPAGPGNFEAKADILSAAASFWNRNRHMVGIVFDKLMQYQIVDPNDVVAWTFVNRVGGKGTASSLNAFEWDLLKGALDKANGRVMIARRRVTQLRKDEEDKRAQDKAGDVAMDVDADTKQEEDPLATDGPLLTTALKAFVSLTREQKATLSRTLDGFIACLAPQTDAMDTDGGRPIAVISENAWSDRENWGAEEWNAWETWGWYRQFCRSYSPYLRNYAMTLGAVSFTRLEGSLDPAAEALKRTWNIATGQA